MCIDDKLLDELKEKSRKNKQKDRTSRKITHAIESLSTEKFRKMITYENEFIIVLDKPNGVPCQQGTGLNIQTSPSIDLMANAYLRKTADTDGFLVHRLDMSASGLMVIAKTHGMAQHLS